MDLYKVSKDYTYYVNHKDLPSTVGQILYVAAAYGRLGRRLDYYDGDFKVTPKWNDQTTMALTDDQLNTLLNCGPIMTDVELVAFNNLRDQMLRQYNSDQNVELAVALELARRFILNRLSTDNKQIALFTMRDNTFAIAFSW